MNEVIGVIGGLVQFLFQQPAVQGAVVAVATEAVKKSPVGRAGGPRTRLLAATLAVTSTLVSAAYTGSLESLSPEVLGEQVLEALAAFLAAVGAWQLSKKPEA